MKLKLDIFLILLCLSIFLRAKANDSVQCHDLENIEEMLRNGEILCGKKVCIFDLNFDFGKWDLKDASKDKLDEVVTLMEEYTDMSVRVVGHTDSIDTEEYNDILSRNRAREVAKYLSEQLGLEESIDYCGYGESQPIDNNGTEFGRQRNRRVELDLTFGCEREDSVVVDSSYDNFFIPDTILPRAYRQLVETHMKLCEGNNPPTLDGGYKIVPRVRVWDEERLSDIYMWFVIGGWDKKNLSFYEKEGRWTKSVSEHVTIKGEGDCFTAYFVAEARFEGGNYYKKTYIVSGRVVKKGIEDIEIFTLMLDKYDPYGIFKKVGYYEFTIDGDGMSEVEQWKIGVPKDRPEPPKRKNKRWCPSCP